MGRLITKLTLLTAVLTAVVSGLAPGAASAHSGIQSYVYFEIFDDAIAGRVEYPINDLNEVLGLDLPAVADDAQGALEANRAVIEDYTLQHLAIFSAEGVEWTYTFENEIETLEAFNSDYAIFNFEIDEAFDPPPRQFVVEYDGIIESGLRSDAFLLIATDFGSGTFNNEAGEFARFTSDNVRQEVDLDDASFWKGVRGTIGLGSEHIQIGTDHILFVLALVLPSALVFVRRPGTDERGEWLPSNSFVSSLWRILKIATMFTIAHSITLALGGFQIIELSPRLVESIIAISIAIAALHNIRPIWPNKEWLMAFAFGLFHGFGFAGLLSDLGLDRSNRFVSLLGFNIGVEIGQAAIILMVFPILFLLRRTRAFVPMMYTGSVGLAIIALSWAFERIFDYDTSINSLVEPVLRWPRSALLVIAALAGAAALYAFDRSRNALRGVVSFEDHETAEDVADLVDA